MDIHLEIVPHGAVRDQMRSELQDSEAVVSYAEGLLKVVSPLFDKCAAVLTSERFILFTPGWPWGFRIRGAEPRTACALIKHRLKFDGSQLMVLRHGEETRCLYFPRGWREQAEQIRAGLSSDVEEEPTDAFDTNVEALRELANLGEMFVPPPPVPPTP